MTRDADDITPSVYVSRVQISYKAPAGSLFHKVIDREQWPITAYARQLQLRGLRALEQPPEPCPGCETLCEECQ